MKNTFIKDAVEGIIEEVEELMNEEGYSNKAAMQEVAETTWLGWKVWRAVNKKYHYVPTLVMQNGF